MKVSGRRLACWILLCTMCAGMTVRADNNSTIDSIRKQINEAKEQKKATEDAKKVTEDNLGGLNSARNSLQGQLNSLTEDLMEISENLEEIESDIIEKNDEIWETQQKLELAKETEASQYAAMKRRIRYLYEEGNQTYLDLLINAKSFSEMLNQSTYIQKLQEFQAVEGSQFGYVIILEAEMGQIAQGCRKLDIGNLISIQIQFFQPRIVGKKIKMFIQGYVVVPDIHHAWGGFHIKIFF